VAYLLASRKFKAFNLVDTLVDIPTVLPPSVAGVALLMAFGRRGLVGAFLANKGITIPFTVIAVVMAQMFVASPFYIKSATIGFSGINKELKQAAALDGANRWQIFRYIILPLSGSALLSGGCNDLGACIGGVRCDDYFRGQFSGRTQTMPLAIYIGFEIELNVALTLSIVLICFSFLTLLLVKAFYIDV
jgi:molybdate transport system permease protein